MSQKKKKNSLCFDFEIVRHRKNRITQTPFQATFFLGREIEKKTIVVRLTEDEAKKKKSEFSFEKTNLNSLPIL